MGPDARASRVGMIECNVIGYQRRRCCFGRRELSMYGRDSIRLRLVRAEPTVRVNRQ